MRAIVNLELGNQLGNRPSVQILVVVAITQVDSTDILSLGAGCLP